MCGHAIIRFRRCSPASDHRVERNGQAVDKEFQPGDVLDIIASYKDCDGIPIRNLPVTFTVVAGAASMVPTGAKQAATFLTNETGGVLFCVWTNPNMSPGSELCLRLRIESSCVGKTLIDQDILLRLRVPPDANLVQGA